MVPTILSTIFPAMPPMRRTRRSLLIMTVLALAPFSSLIVSAAELGNSEVKKLKKELKLYTQAGNAVKMTGLVGRLSRMDDAKAVEILVEAAVVIPSFKNYEIARKALVRFARPATVEAMVAIATQRKGDWRFKVLLLEAFGARRDKKSLEAVFIVLAKGNIVHSRLAAIRACVSRKQKEAIPELIAHVDRNEKQRNRDWLEARQALLDLTNQDFESVEDWKNYWEANKRSIDPKNLDRKDGPTKVVVKKTKDSVEFFGSEILSQNVVFVIDCSGSMIMYDEDPEYTGDNIEFDRRRVERAKAQTLRAVRKLRKKSRFNIITYNSRVFMWQSRKSGKRLIPKIVPATVRSVKAAQKFVKGFQATQLTHTDEALEKAFQDPAIDTIVLLSDGAPFKGNQGGGDLQKKILERVKDLNAGRKLRIDTFGFEGGGKYPKSVRGGAAGGGGGPESPMVKFLKELAKRNGGEYRPIK